MPHNRRGRDDPDRIFDKSTVWRPLTPNDKLVVYGIDDPVGGGRRLPLHRSRRRAAIKGTLGLAEDVSDISLACRQVGPVQFKGKFEQGEVVFSERRSLIFKSMQIVRGCDAKRNTLIYMVYSDRVIQGSPKNSTSTRAADALGHRSRRRAAASSVKRLSRARSIRRPGPISPGR